MDVDRTMPWLVFPAAVDLANTVVVSGRREVDLLTTEEELDAWAAAETGRIPGVGATAGRLGEVRHLRGLVRPALFAAAERRPLPMAAVASLNTASAGAPSYPVLRGDRIEEVVLTDDAFCRFRAGVARSAIELLAGGDRDVLSVCRAPSCGMLFVPRGPRQRWCCDGCGNRARVARHAQRRREEAAARESRR